MQLRRQICSRMAWLRMTLQLVTGPLSRWLKCLEALLREAARAKLHNARMCAVLHGRQPPTAAHLATNALYSSSLASPTLLAHRKNRSSSPFSVTAMLRICTHKPCILSRQLMAVHGKWTVLPADAAPGGVVIMQPAVAFACCDAHKNQPLGYIATLLLPNEWSVMLTS